MNILLLGYGKMGKIIGDLAESRGHQIVGKINIDQVHDIAKRKGIDEMKMERWLSPNIND